jgi:hypothetical protein
MAKYCLVALILMVPQIGNAQSVSCRGGIVSQGDTKSEVRAKCGEPTEGGYRTGQEEPAIGKVAPPSAGDDSWTYNFGPSSLMQRIWFVDGLVTSVESLGYGH